MNFNKLEILDIDSESVSVIDTNKGVISFNIEDVSMEVCNDSFGHAFGAESCDSYFEFDANLIFDYMEDVDSISDDEMKKVKEEVIKLINELPTGTLHKLFW